MVVVLTVDQRDSRSHADEVPDLLARLAGAPGLLRPFQRTVGDEVQAVLADADAAVGTIGLLLRAGGWSVGVGVGPVEEPLPADTRAGRGAAYLHARDAVTRAKSVPHRIAVGGEDYRAEQLETVLWLWAGILERRTDRGWEVVDALDEGLSHVEAGRRLGISQSAVSQRAQAAGLVDERRARRLAGDLLADLLAGPAGSTPNAPRTEKEDRR
ncbi:transposase [Nocardioides panacis]|uniref:Transposase n=1 Tax=Nocardioides panacis TaxID=2849501 RepID=A0A975T1G9_9ACTN|nr:transposase [Nocardioides panacis]QWZ09138.1 transposase [Nocardioides panacis]